MRTAMIKIALAVVILTVGAVARPESSQSSTSSFSRLGLKGLMGYLITEVDPRVNQPEIQVGDIIVGTDLTGQTTSMDQYQNTLRRSAPGQTLRARVLRYNGSTSQFDELEKTLTTFPSPSGQFSRLGLIGRPGYFVEEIDPAVNQPEIKLRDMILATNLSGQIVDIEQFQTQIRQTTVGLTIQATVLRYNASTSKFDELASVLRTFPFPNSNRHHGRSTQSCVCGRVPCEWCCQCCPQSTHVCTSSACETGRTNCSDRYYICAFKFCT
jgi:hypothetical protein